MSWISLVRTILLAWMATAPVCAWAAGGYLYDVVGSVSVAVGKNAPRPAEKNDSVVSGMVIRTGDNSSAVLKFDDGQVVSMQANSTFQVREYIYQPENIEESSIVFSVFKGGMRFITGEIGQRNKQAFKLVSPNATIRIRGTEFMIVMAANNAVYSQVISGSISMTNAAGMAIINAGQTALTSSATALTATIPAASVPAGIFSQIAAIPVPVAAVAPISAPTAVAASTGTATTTAAGGAAAGGAAAGGAAVGASAGGMFGGVSATTIGIGVGVGVAAVAAAVVNNTTTTRH